MGLRRAARRRRIVAAREERRVAERDQDVALEAAQRGARGEDRIAGCRAGGS